LSIPGAIRGRQRLQALVDELDRAGYTAARLSDLLCVRPGLLVS
jgi:hypothetical protein